ncbi:hypothetical protein KUV57_11005 [Epibacterium sp. DP7N7-1]|nr:hypothetical protein [Epibacterium sp. DP7N7-1]
MNNQPNPDDFSLNDKPREYEVRIRIEGEMRRTIKADSLEEAEDQAEKIADDIAEGREIAELHEVGDVAVDSCRRATPLFRVLRDGQPYQVSRLLPGDLPREPDERGF